MNQPCLPVPRRRKRDEEIQDVSFDNIESMDAMEYMAAVVQQANAMPEFFVAKTSAPTATNSSSCPTAALRQPQCRGHDLLYVPIDGSAASIQYLISDRTAVLPPPTEKHIPVNCRDWVDGTLANFSVLRDYLETCQRQGVGGKLTERIQVPPMRDQSAWNIFCVGPEEAERDRVLDSSSQDGEEKEPDTDANLLLPWRSELPPSGHEPSVDLLLQLDQVMIRRILPHLALDCTVYSSKRTAWLYALLSRLERPIHRDDAATLYGLLKALTQSRAKVDPNSVTSDELARLNILICVVGIYFEQGGGFNNVFGC